MYADVYLSRTLDSAAEGDVGIEDITHGLISGFQAAVFQGPLCSEPVEGVAFIIEDCSLDLKAAGGVIYLSFN